MTLDKICGPRRSFVIPWQFGSLHYGYCSFDADLSSFLLFFYLSDISGDPNTSSKRDSQTNYFRPIKILTTLPFQNYLMFIHFKSRSWPRQLSNGSLRILLVALRIRNKRPRNLWIINRLYRENISNGIRICRNGRRSGKYRLCANSPNGFRIWRH